MDKPIESSKAALPDSSLRWIMAILVLGLLVTGGTIVYGVKSTKSNLAETTSTSSANSTASTGALSSSSPASSADIDVVSALGRVEPLGEVIKLSPSPNMGGSRIYRILVPEGANVKAGAR
jgi:multidrug efflux pump subunit AcrA (membrane-fusion protein)